MTEKPHGVRNAIRSCFRRSNPPPRGNPVLAQKPAPPLPTLPQSTASIKAAASTTPAASTKSPASIKPPASIKSPASTTPAASAAPAASTLRPSLTPSRSPALDQALTAHLQKIPESEKGAFSQAFKKMNLDSLLSEVEAYDERHKNESAFRPYADRLSRTLDLLSRLMGGVAIGIQANPEISAIVIGSLRVVIDLALKFSTYFSRLSDMICAFKQFLEPLGIIEAIDIPLLVDNIAKIYANIVDFGWRARGVFIDQTGVDKTRQPRKGTSFKTFVHQNWETFESEFMSIKEDMQKNLQVLSLTVQGLHFDLFQKTEQVRRLKEEAKERMEFLKWLSSIDFEKVHEDMYAKKHDRTCEWLTGDAKFQGWFTQTRSSLLWCYGKRKCPEIGNSCSYSLAVAGIGKSIMTSHVLEHIISQKSLQDSSAICFAYYNYRDARLGDASNIIGALMKQICRDRNEIPQKLQQHQHQALESSLLGTLDQFLLLVKNIPQLFVIFDALDECPERSRSDIIGFITGLVDASVTCCIKVFVTSRREVDIVTAFEGIDAVQMQAERVSADIEAFTLDRVEELRSAQQNGKRLHIRSDDLKDEIVRTLASKADGMFLWVNLQLNELCRVSNLSRKDSDVKKALERLPRGLADTYVRILDQIDDQPQESRELALECLAWTLYAPTPLDTNQLQIVLAINEESKTLNDLDFHDPDVIVGACGNLLELEEVVHYRYSHRIRPIHYTVQEFLGTSTQGEPDASLRQQLLDSNAMHRKLGTKCLRYIQLAAFRKPAQDIVDALERFWFYEFAHYACSYFDYHIVRCRDASVLPMRELEHLLRQKGGHLAAVLQLKALAYRSRDEYFNPMSFDVSPPAFICRTQLYTLPDLRKRWPVDASSKYALHLAISAGHADAVPRILQAGCDINEQDGTGATPAYYACLGGHSSILRILINAKADINVLGGYYGGTLHAASARNDVQMLHLLLQTGVNVNGSSGKYGTALQVASDWAHEQIIQLLLDAGADINAQGGENGTALQVASYRGHEHIVQFLLKKGADANVQGGQFGNPLQVASHCQNLQIVQWLLDSGADVNVQGGRYGNALQAASERGNKQIVQLLLDKRADVNALGGQYNTALQAASQSRCHQIVQWLVDNGADVNVQGGQWGNALAAASSEGSIEIAQTLLDKGADVNAHGRGGNSPLITAAHSAQDTSNLIQLLLDNGADINAQNEDQRTALHLAASKGHSNSLRLLLDRAKLDDDALVFAASESEHERLDAVRLLLERGADVNAQSKRDGNALQAAAREGRLETMQLLIDKGADVNAKGGPYGNAMQAAIVKAQHEAMVLLLDNGAYVDPVALLTAVRSGREETVKLVQEMREWQDKNGVPKVQEFGPQAEPPKRPKRDHTADLFSV